MLITNRFKLPLEVSPRILEAVCMFNNADRSYSMNINTYADKASLHLYDLKTNKLVHSKEYGNDAEIMAWGALDRSTFIFLLLKENKIVTINVDTWEEKSHPFEFLCPEFPNQSKLAFFPESRLLCISEMGSPDKTKCRFTFLDYEFKEIWKHENEEGLYNHTIYAINETGKMAYFSGRPEQKLTFTVLDSVLKKVEKHEVDKPGTCEMALREIYELNPGDYFLSIDTSEAKFRHIVYTPANGKSRDFTVPMPDRIYDINLSGDFLIVFCYGISEDGFNIPAPIIFINRKKEKIFYQAEGQIIHGIDYFISTEGDSSIVELHNVYHNPKEVEIKTFRPVNQKELFVHLAKAQKLSLDRDEIVEVLKVIDYDTA